MKVASSLALRCGLFVVTLALVCGHGAQAHSRPKWNELDDYTFEQYVHDFDKPYRYASSPTDVVEMAKRKAVFAENLKTIKEHNVRAVKGLSTYKMGVNHMADWTLEERQGLNGGKARQMHHLKGMPRPARPYVSTWTSGVPFPKGKDYRLTVPPVLTAIKSQSQCGDCYVFGAVETIESYKAIMTGELYSLSVEQPTACAPNPDQCGGTGGCQGGITEIVYDYAKEGLTQEWDYPFYSHTGKTGKCLNKTDQGYRYVFTDGFVRLPTNNQTAVVETLLTVGPIAVNVDASDWWFYEGGIFDGCSYNNNVSLDHVVQLVGYGHDDALQSDYWIIRNSWGPTYGEQGYIRLWKSSDNDKPTCGWDVGADAGTSCKGGPDKLYVCGACGVLWDTVYPLVRK